MVEVTGGHILQSTILVLRSDRTRSVFAGKDDFLDALTVIFSLLDRRPESNYPTKSNGWAFHAQPHFN